MHVEVASKFSTLDFCVFAAMLVVSGGIGVYTSCKGNKTPEEFLMGNRSFGPISISMSLLTSFVSSISLLGFSGEAYAYGCQVSTFVVGVALGITFAGYIIVPVIYPLKLTSINEYIGLRFKSRLLMSVISFLTCLQGILYMGVCLYAPTIALVSVTSLNYLTYIFLLGTICTFYSSFGGIRAVVWTDVFQLSVMFVGLIVINAIGASEIGGMVKALSVADEGGRIELFNVNPSPYVRHTLLNTIGFGFFMYAQMYGTNQINVQRMCSVRTISDAQKVLILNVIGMFLIYFLIFVGGLIAYATYATCDPLLEGVIEKKEEIMPHFIVDRLSFIPGLPGVFVATLVGGTLSSLSSVVNATVAMIWKDACLKFSIFKHASHRFATLSNKLLSLFTGILLIGFALLASLAESLVELAITIAGVILGPIFGVFLIGFLFPKCNMKGVWTGFITSSLFVSWISVGGIIYKESPVLLPMSIKSCVDLEFIANSTNWEEVVGEWNSTVTNHEDNINEFPLMSLYRISYTFYCIIGPCLCVLLALVISCITGNESVEELSPAYVTPCVRRFYWSKTELESFQKTQNRKFCFSNPESNHFTEMEFDTFLDKNNLTIAMHE